MPTTRPYVDDYYYSIARDILYGGVLRANHCLLCSGKLARQPFTQPKFCEPCKTVAPRQCDGVLRWIRTGRWPRFRQLSRELLRGEHLAFIRRQLWYRRVVAVAHVPAWIWYCYSLQLGWMIAAPVGLAAGFLAGTRLNQINRRYRRQCLTLGLSRCDG